MKIFRGQQQPKERRAGDEMGMWFSLKKSLHCKTEPSDVHDPKAVRHLNPILTRKTGAVSGRSGCSRSIANLKDVIHGSKRHMDMRSNCSPRSIGSSEFLNPISHEVILSNSRCELKISRFNNGFHEGLIANKNGNGVGKRNGCSTFVGTLRPGTPGPGGHPTMHYFNNSPKTGIVATPRRSGFKLSGETDEHVNFKGSGGFAASKTANVHCSYNGSSAITCHKCGEQFTKREAAESHHLSKHAVTELEEGDSSRKIVEIICNTSWTKSQETNPCHFERVLKVHNMQKTLARFEEYREMVKIKASKLSKKHPRCLADGNELLRFYGTTVACGLGLNGRSSLCSSEKCSVCRIIQNGFSVREGGVFTASTSGRALESIELIDEDYLHHSRRKALIVCRVIAGRIRKPVGDFQEITCQIGFDSFAGKVGLYSNIEELYLLSPRALLPCFVVICKH